MPEETKIIEPIVEKKTEEKKTEVKQYDEDYVKRLRDENKSTREKADALAKDNAELAKYKSDKEAAELAAEKKWQELADVEKKRADDTTKAADEKVAKAERAAILAEAKARAIKEGIKDIDDVKLLDLSTAKIDGDEVVGLDEIIATAKEKKPHWFGVEVKKKEVAGATASASGKEGAPKSSLHMTDEEFQSQKEKMGLIRNF